jgi:hypothetical protein
MRRLWDVMAARSPIPHIPSIMAGFDARPMILAGQIQPREDGGWPLLNGHETWFTRTPAAVGSFVRDAITWVETHPAMRVEPAPAPPLILIQAWNELQEGSYLVPTDGDGYGYLQAVAEAAGMQWAPPPRRTLRVNASNGATVTSAPPGIRCPPTCDGSFDEGFEVTLRSAAGPGFVLDRWTGCTEAPDGSCSLVVLDATSVAARITAADQRRTISFSLHGHLAARGRLRSLDGYAACANQEPVQIQQRRASRWVVVAVTRTTRSGTYSIGLRDRAGTYRALVPRSAFAGHSCRSTSSRLATYAR